MHDIVGSLPPELLLQVTRYLDPEDIVRNQRVSKRWHSIFSCDIVIKPVLRPALALLGLGSEGVSTDVKIDDAIKIIRWRRGLECARPVKKVFLPWPEPKVTPISPMPSEIRYRSRRLCYDRPNCKTVEMLDLDAAVTEIWTDGEKQFDDFILSDRYLVLSTLGTDDTNYLIAWDIQTKQRLDQRIPSFSGQYTIVGDRVVITPKSGVERLFTSIYVWNLSTNHVQKIGSFFNLRLWHVDIAEDILVACELDLGKEKQTVEVRLTSWKTTTGRRLKKKVSHLPLRTDRQLKERDVTNRHCQTFGHKTVTQLFFVRRKYAAMHLEYDNAVQKLNLRWISAVGRFTKDSIHSAIYLTPYLACHMTWIDGDPWIAIYNATIGTVALCPMQLLPNHSNPPQWREENKPLTPVFLKVFGDREVLGLASEAGIELWFFNPNFVPDIPLQRISGHKGSTIRSLDSMVKHEVKLSSACP